MIPDETVEQVREAADIVQIIGEYVTLKRTGTDFRGPCPFHQGVHRNFSVSPKKHIYYCFVCHEGGDVFHFLQKRLGMEWPAAVKSVAAKEGIEIKEVDTRREGPDPREPFWEVNATVAAYFRRVLWDEPQGAQAREYLAQRDITREVAEEFGIGFAPREIGLMRAYMSTLGFDEARLVEAGLVTRGEEGSEPRPRFRGRLIFPILDAKGHTAGFGGRILGQGEPKYLNSPESPVFSKGKILYALNWAQNEIRRQDRALVVEGYFDAVRLMAAGVTTAVAPMGTALTAEQTTLLRRLTRNVFLLYDSDKAGLQATFRSGDELLRQGMSVRVVTLPGGEDPDTFVRAHGAAGLESALDGAIDIFERKIQLLERAGWFSELQKKRRALDRLLPTIRATSDGIMRDLYIARASEVTGVAREVLQRELGIANPRSPESTQHSVPAPRISPARARRSERRPGNANSGSSAERELIRAMLLKPDRVEAIAEKVGPPSFHDPQYRAIYTALIEADGDAGIEQLAGKLGEEAVGIIEELLAAPTAQVDPTRTINDSISALRGRDIGRRLAEIDRIMPIASSEEKDGLTQEKQQLTRELGGSGQNRFKAFTQRRPE